MSSNLGVTTPRKAAKLPFPIQRICLKAVREDSENILPSDKYGAGLLTVAPRSRNWDSDMQNTQFHSRILSWHYLAILSYYI